jgi:drug/metabolite transporter (DMT)-like permease
MSAPYAATVVTGNDRVQRLAGGRPTLFALLGAACISPSAILVQLADSGVATTAFFRCLLALPVLFTLAEVERRRIGGRALMLRARAFVAGVFLAGDLVMWNHAIADVGAGVATVLGNLQVLFVTFVAWMLWRERPSGRFLLMLPVVMAGVALVAGLAGSGIHGAHPVAGIVYGVGTSASYACFLIILRQTTAGWPHVAGPLADAIAGSAVGALLLGLAFGGLQFSMPWRTFGWLLLLAMSSQTIGWLLITSSLPRLPAAISSLLLLVQPIVALLLAYLVLSQQPSLLQLAGAALVCCGVLVASRTAAAGSVEAVPPDG